MTTNYVPSPAEHRLLWLLVASGGEEFEATLKPTDAKRNREALAREKLIEVEKRIKPPATKRSRPVNYLKLTDAGWAWCNLDMSWPLPRAKSKADLFLNSLLRRMKVMFDRQGTAASLADFINQSNATDPEPQPIIVSEKPDTPAIIPAEPPATAEEIAQAVRDACLELSGGVRNERIKLADLRRRLLSIDYEVVKASIWDMALRKELALETLDDPREVDAEDIAAAILSSTGIPLYIIYYGGVIS